ncbi:MULTISPECIES: chemotaxis protein [unclassified Streptomyces]|uniref:baeRF3 domain-containing protein n=1 Tax=unclassified Streptomyces TaxID=2593676 RepID=UPI0019058B55|nr:chemotaxis protein [Streptomyces sp. HSG2]
MEHDFTPAALTDLRRPRPYPAVTVLTPTHRRGRDATQDRLRLRHAVSEAKRRIATDPAVDRERRVDVTRRLDRALAEVDPALAEDGLALFAAPGEHHVWALSRTVPERVVVSDTFLTRNLVAAHTADRPYWVLAVSAARVSLWSGTPDRVVEARVAGFPATRPREDFDPERRERIGDAPSTFREEGTRRFLREADAALGGVLRRHPRPLYVTGPRAALAQLDGAGVSARGAVHIPHGGLAQGPAEAVWQAVRPLIAAEESRSADAVARELESARGRRDFAAGVDELWQSARSGRVRLLAVEENYRATVVDAGDHLEPAEADDPGVREDIVDEIVERCFDTGADIRFVPDGTLGENHGIAGVLRY